MDFWEFSACVAGHNRAHGGEKVASTAPAPPSREAFRRAVGLDPS